MDYEDFDASDWKEKLQEAPDTLWQVWRLHESLKVKWGSAGLGQLMKAVNGLACKKAEAGEILEILPFRAYYETYWNGRTGYSRLCEQVSALQVPYFPGKAGSDEQAEQFGKYMAAMADGYELMEEEAYDQREPFACRLQEGAVVCKRQWKGGLSFRPEEAMTAYGLFKGVRLQILEHELYGPIAKAILLTGKALDVMGDGRELKDLFVRLAGEEYEKLKKERPYYEI